MFAMQFLLIKHERCGRTTFDVANSILVVLAHVLISAEFAPGSCLSARRLRHQPCAHVVYKVSLRDSCSLPLTPQQVSMGAVSSAFWLPDNN
jgi:hypothetical protein